jgi:hypothetical protein
MMVRDPFRMMFVPPIAVVPRMMVIPITVGAAPILVMLRPLGMMPPDPSWMMVVPPIRVMPRMMLVPITIVVGMCHHRRSREEGRQRCGGEKRSKFHSGYLLRKAQWEVGIHLTSINTMHRKCQFQAPKKPEKKPPKYRHKSPQVVVTLQILQMKCGVADYENTWTLLQD